MKASDTARPRVRSEEKHAERAQAKPEKGSEANTQAEGPEEKPTEASEAGPAEGSGKKQGRPLCHESAVTG